MATTEQRDADVSATHEFFAPADSNFSHRRTPLQALGWYLSYLLANAVILGILIKIGGPPCVGVTACVSVRGELGYQLAPIGVLLLWSRRKGPVNILLALAGVVLSPFGPLIGLVPLAALTIRRPKKGPREITEVFE
jgi:hypothetical protein